jgi:hypothetical protein
MQQPCCSLWRRPLRTLRLGWTLWSWCLEHKQAKCVLQGEGGGVPCLFRNVRGRGPTWSLPLAYCHPQIDKLQDSVNSVIAKQQAGRSNLRVRFAEGDPARPRSRSVDGAGGGGGRFVGGNGGAPSAAPRPRAAPSPGAHTPSGAPAPPPVVHRRVLMQGTVVRPHDLRRTPLRVGQWSTLAGARLAACPSRVSFPHLHHLRM